MQSYASLSARLLSFQNWKESYPAEKLAAAGFYCSLDGRYAVCYQCGVRICQWDIENDIPDLEHLRFSPACALVRERHRPETVLLAKEIVELKREISELKKKYPAPILFPPVTTQPTFSFGYKPKSVEPPCSLGTVQPAAKDSDPAI